jgi:class 3 adenylate cyclase
MPELPSGTVTFVFSDLEGSTRLLKQLGDDQFAELLAAHRALVRDVFPRHGGNEIDTQGDAFFYSFARARSAVAAAVELQRAHAEHAWPGGVTVNVRLGLHTGEPVVGDEGYTGLDVVRAARIAADGKGGQILLSGATRAIVGANLPNGVGIRELGERTLKDIDQPEPLFELVYAPEPATPKAVSAVQAQPPVDSVSFDVKPASVLKQWQQLARVAIDAARRDEDPGRLIEERVLAQLKESFGDAVVTESRKAKDKPAESPEIPAWWTTAATAAKPTKSAKRAQSGESVADGLSRLNELREAGALSEEQYSKAVDRLLAEG